MSVMVQNLRSAKGVTFVAVMSALGNVLSGLSITIAPLVPSLPLGPISFSLAIDLSHITTFIAALFGGVGFGGLTGLIGGLVAAYKFGFSQGNLLTGFALPIGKALTGITAGMVMRVFEYLSKRDLVMVPAAVVAYLPEAFFTVFVFIVVFPMVYGPQVWLVALTAQILAKAFVEMFVMGMIMAALLKNHSFTNFVKGFFS